MTTKDKEKNILDIIKSNSGVALSQTPGQFDLYDAQNNNYIVEIKIRDKYYSEKSLECIKFFHLINESQKQGKSFLYVVSDEKGIHVFNVTKHTDEILKSGIRCYEMPINTEFGNRRKIKKYVFNLKEDLAKRIES